MRVTQYVRRSAEILLIACLVESVAAQCIAIERWRSGDYPSARVHENFEITKPGRYCLTEDITAERRFSIPEGGERASHAPIGHIRASNVEIDLQGHSLVAKVLGAWVLDAENGEVRIAHLTVRNGTLSSRSDSGMRASFLLGPYFGSIRSDFTLTFGNAVTTGSCCKIA